MILRILISVQVLDLFSGIGGFTYGLQLASSEFQPAAFAENNPYCISVLNKHWPDVKIYEDVKEVSAERLVRDSIPDIYVVVGGFPCQDLSKARTPHGDSAGLYGERSGLWSEFKRIISELRPSYVIVENVSALTVRGLLDVLGDLAECGYDAEWANIPAGAVGSPQLRKRLFIVSYPNRAGPQGEILTQVAREIEGRYDADAARSDWLYAASRVLRSANGVSKRMDRLASIGNSVCPQIIETIGASILHARNNRAA